MRREDNRGLAQLNVDRLKPGNIFHLQEIGKTGDGDT
jgi:hypothetical protein